MTARGGKGPVSLVRLMVPSNSTWPLLLACSGSPCPCHCVTTKLYLSVMMEWLSAEEKGTGGSTALNTVPTYRMRGGTDDLGVPFETRWTPTIRH